MNKKQTIVLIATLIAAVTLPYLFGFGWAVGGDRVFNGFLLNPIDGNSYLAKMNQSWRGDWKFRLPYSAENGDGAYIHLFYLFLGYFARWAKLPVLLVFHAARVVGAGLLAWALVAFIQRVVFIDRPGLARVTAWLAAFGSGMGWLVVFSGLLPSDFWVAEAYPFLSAYQNPHFVVGLAILVGILLCILSERRGWHYVILALAGLLEAVILPFGMVVIALVLAGWGAWAWVEAGPAAGRRVLEPAAALGLLGGPYLLYMFWITQTDPFLAGWNAQNLTPSPPLWDFVLSLSPALALACLGAVDLWKMKDHPARRVLIAWLVLGGLLVYAPFGLQRRFLTGLYIPAALLAGFGIGVLQRRVRGRWLVPVVMGCSLATNGVLILGGILGIVGGSEQIFLSRAEYRALQWLGREASPGSLVLASPQIGNYVPALTLHRVIYGHPFETVNAAGEEAEVRGFFSGTWSAAEMQAFLTARGVDYIFFGEREQALAQREPSAGRVLLHPLPAGVEPVFEDGAVTVYAVRKRP